VVLTLQTNVSLAAALTEFFQYDAGLSIIFGRNYYFHDVFVSVYLSARLLRMLRLLKTFWLPVGL